MLDYVLSKVSNGYSPKANGRPAKKAPRHLANGHATTLNGTKTDLDDIDLLTSLISSSAAEIKSRYRSFGLPPPSLDESSASSLDITDEDSRQAITKATRVIEAACAQLRATISRPEHVLLDVSHPFSNCTLTRLRNRSPENLLGTPDCSLLQAVTNTTDSLRNQLLSRLYHLPISQGFSLER